MTAEEMVRWQLEARDIADPRVLATMRAVARHEFVPHESRDEAYEDHPISIGYGQTISQPYMVAWMTQTLEVAQGMGVLEVGTGSGYQAAVLAEMGAEVYSLEIVPELAERARETLARLGYTAVHVRLSTGYEGWPEAAPFDRILLTAAPPEVPQTLIDQLADEGRLVAPVGRSFQVIEIIERHGDRVDRRSSLEVRFVPMR